MSKFDKKRSSKRRAIDEKVMSKAKKYVKFSEEREEAEEPVDLHQLSLPTVNIDLAPRVKLRKPRHSALTKQDGGGSVEVPTVAKAVASATAATTKKKNKKKRKRKPEAVQQIATPENEQKHTTEALDFLNKWNLNRSEWKFEKLKQVWLLKHALQSSAIDEEHFEILLNFIGSIKGQARRSLQSDMEATVRNHEKNNTDKDNSEPNEEESEKYERARQILQMLTDDA